MHDSSLFLSVLPGLEPAAAAEARALGLTVTSAQGGGVCVQGSWPEAARANMWLRIPGRVLLRVAQFRAMHLAQLDKRLRRIDWSFLPQGPVRIEATCRKSRIYHAGAATQRLRDAIARPDGDGATLMLRIEDDLATVSIDTSGEALHRRGYKLSIGKAPLRETMAAGFLSQMGFDGSQPVLDPMCGSGTIVTEAARIAANIAPGQLRDFAMQSIYPVPRPDMPAVQGPVRFYGRDRDQGAVQRAALNAQRAGVAAICDFHHGAISDLTRPEGPAGIVLVNPPYGARIGNRNLLRALYGTFGKVMSQRFQGWQIGLITSDAGLAKATDLNMRADITVPHGGLRVTLYRADL